MEHQLQETNPRLHRPKRLPSRYKDNEVLKKCLENNIKRVTNFSECKQTTSPPLTPNKESTKRKIIQKSPNNSTKPPSMCRKTIFSPLTPFCPNEKQKEMENKLAVYDFTFDADEEPPPKQANNHIIRKKSVPKPKLYYLNNNYEKNLMGTLQHLKGKLSKAGIYDSSQNNNENMQLQNGMHLDIPQNPMQQRNNSNLDSSSSNSAKPQTPNQKNNILRKESIASNSSKKNYLAKPWRVDTDLQKPNLYYERTFQNEPTPDKNSVQPNILSVDAVPNDWAKLKQTSMVSFLREENITYKKTATSTNSNVLESSIILEIDENNISPDEARSSEKVLLPEKTTIMLLKDDIEGLDENQENVIPIEHVTGNENCQLDDIEVVHHLKANRKSYGKAKK